MDKHFKAARKVWGLPKFERNCRIDTMGGRRMKAYRIPGTPEHGRYCTLMEYAQDTARKLRKEGTA